MLKTALITGADRGLGFALSAELLKRGWQVFAGMHNPDWPELADLAPQYPGRLQIVPLDVSSGESVQAAAQAVAKISDHIDMLINNAGVSSRNNPKTIRQPQDYAEMHRQFDINSLGPLRVVEAFLPLTDRGAMKRLCFVSSEAGSIGKSTRGAWYGYCMSKAALNMAVKNLFNLLRPEGYSFRLYHPGWLRTYMGGTKNMEADLEADAAAEMAVRIFLRKRNEDRLALVDYQGHSWPW
jgi:NAD(P)-dependent dehydrogenase (short-subunit alcohol dehydrogenase family)